MKDTCYGRVDTRGAAQEWYETASRAAGRRARALRELGFRVTTSAMGEQVTNVGRVRMTLVTIQRGEGDLFDIPQPERLERGSL